MIARKVIINAAREVGFDLVGVVRAEPMAAERKRFEEWLLAGHNSTLEYLERNVEKRFDAALLQEGTLSIVVCAVSYLSTWSRGYDAACDRKIASYALAKDYHKTIKRMLADLAERLRSVETDIAFRAFTDSAPLAEKSLAVRAGLGWIGRNSLLVTPTHGSMLLLGELLINAEVDEYDQPLEGVGCGSCRACVERCPNSAILDSRAIDTHRCISCRTIEREGQGAKLPLHGWIFGCDECQTVCPFNAHAPLHTNPRFDALFDPTAVDWEAMTEAEFSATMGDTVLTRSGLERIKRNVGR